MSNSLVISVQALSHEEWLVTVDLGHRTEHRVRITPDDLHRYGAGRPAEELLKASFQFLLEREPNTSILSSFDLPVIQRYFPEYQKEIKRLLKK